MTPPRFKVERKNSHGTVTWLRDTEDMPSKQWTIPTSLAAELNRLYDLEAEHESTKRELGQALDDAAKCARAIALCDQLHEGWDDPDGWDYGLSPDELGDRVRDGHRVQYLSPYGNEWIDNALTESDLRLGCGAALYYRASKQPSPSKTENVPLHKVIGRTLPGRTAPIFDIMWLHTEHTWKWRGYAMSWHPLPVNDDGTVTVLVDAPAATSDKGAS